MPVQKLKVDFNELDSRIAIGRHVYAYGRKKLAPHWRYGLLGLAKPAGALPDLIEQATTKATPAVQRVHIDVLDITCRSIPTIPNGGIDIANQHHTIGVLYEDVIL